MGKKAQRKAACRRGDGWRCHYCHEWFGKKRRKGAHLTIDHVIPKSLGGPDHAWNRVLACFDCNTLKGSTTYEEFTGKDRLPPQCWEWAMTTAQWVEGYAVSRVEWMRMIGRGR